MVTPRYRTVPDRARSLGPEIVEFAAEIGVDLDPWQADVLDVFSGVDEDGRWASPTNYLLVARQNGKSMVFIVRALYGMFKLGKKMSLYSSHQWSSSNEAFLTMQAIIDRNPQLEARVEKTRLSAAALGFELDDGARMLFLTRSRAAARGFTGDDIIFDECHFLSEAAHAALRPTLGGRSAEGSVQTLYGSSAVDQHRHPDALVAARLRQRGIAGDGAIGFVEYSAGIVDEEGHEILPAMVPAALMVDPDTLMRANPSCPKRVSLEFLIDEARSLDPASHAVEHLSVGDWPDLDGARSTVVDLEKWAGLIDVDSSPLAPVSIGFDVAPDRRRAAIAIAGRRLDGRAHVEVIDSHEGVGWVAPRLAQLVEDHDPWSVVCDKHQELVAAELEQAVWCQPELLGAAEIAQACASFVDLVEQSEVHHLGSQDLLDALRGAAIRTVGGDGWAFSRRSSAVDLSPLYACVCALMAVRKMPADLTDIHIH